VALKLKRFGSERVRPLLGGIEAWKDLGFPVVPLAEATAAAAPTA
jgi:hypothetical protein